MHRIRVHRWFQNGAIALSIVIALWTAVAQGQSAIRSDFDHDSTGFRLDGAHLLTNCGDCHSRGTFAGTLRQCASCHEQGGIVSASFKPATHILTTQNCETCHATRSFVPVQRVDHNEVIGDCVSCHNNQVAIGKTPTHPQTGDQCDNCHLTVAFSPQRTFDHTGITSNCVSCHNGVTAGGKPINHLPTSNICEDCHNTNVWSIVNFDHLQAVGVCSGCHNGILATGKDADHIPTTLECDACHNTTAF